MFVESGIVRNTAGWVQLGKNTDMVLGTDCKIMKGHLRTCLSDEWSIMRMTRSYVTDQIHLLIESREVRFNRSANVIIK